MTRRTLMIGRSAHADIVIADGGVDARHGELVLTSAGKMYLTDCASEGGIHRRRADEDWTPLRQGFVEDGDDIRFGRFSCSGAGLRQRAEAALADPATSPGTGGGRGAQTLRGAVERDPATGEIVRRRFRD